METSFAMIGCVLNAIIAAKDKRCPHESLLLKLQDLVNLVDKRDEDNSRREIQKSKPNISCI